MNLRGQRCRFKGVFWKAEKGPGVAPSSMMDMHTLSLAHTPEEEEEQKRAAKTAQEKD